MCDNVRDRAEFTCTQERLAGGAAGEPSGSRPAPAQDRLLQSGARTAHPQHAGEGDWVLRVIYVVPGPAYDACQERLRQESESSGIERSAF